ncbi:glycoside hydrolase family 32 protein [Erysipelotrichaceae bacterium RD49]|nr:glycoside hydrolase family 32 protein [Erysipelotrichaceae bacterium RD49]
MNGLQQARDYEKQNRVPREKQPAFHLCPPVGWMNDPNGLSFFNGQVHLFYQYHPYSMHWGPMHWGHQVSEDLMAWKLKPCALAPEDSFDAKGCFSGTALEDNGKHVLVYTGVSQKDGKEVQNQCLAVGNGTEYRKAGLIIDGSMLPTGFSCQDFRDPKLWKRDGRYCLIAGNKDENGQGQIVLFTSSDLQNWQFESVFLQAKENQGQMWECPDFFSIGKQDVLILSPQDMEDNGQGIHNGHNAVAILGHFNGKTFEAQSEMQPLDYGLDFYAPQTFTHPDGRQILIGWMSSWQAPVSADDQKWSSQMTLPRELSIEDGKLVQNPVRELSSYWKNTLQFTDLEIKDRQEIPGVSGRYTDFTLAFKEPISSRFALELAGQGDTYTAFEIDPKHGRIELDRTHSGLHLDYVSLRRNPLPKQGISKLRIVQDLYSIEIFVNDGQMVFSTIIPTDESSDQIRFLAQEKQKIDLEFHEIDVQALRKNSLEA